MSKATSTDAEAPQTFVPVKIEIVFDNQRDLDTFGTIFNHCVVTEFHGLSEDGWNQLCHSILRAVDNKKLNNPGNCDRDDLWDAYLHRLKTIPIR